jgi:hypothetical protein
MELNCIKYSYKYMFRPYEVIFRVTLEYIERMKVTHLRTYVYGNYLCQELAPEVRQGA